MEDIKNTIDTIIINKETTSLKNLIEHGYIEEIGEVYSGTDFNDYCGHHSCNDCKLSSSNYSSDIQELNCGCCSEVYRAIKAMAVVYKAVKNLNCDTNPKSGTCESCKHKELKGDYKYCNAWHNFTTDTMTCGYYESLDNQQKK